MEKETQTYVALGAVAGGYAALLNTAEGRRLAKEQTWLTVVLGTSIVLGALYLLLPRAAWKKVVMAFAVAGSPMVARSVINKALEQE